MNYPLISEYIEAILAAEDNFKELTNLRPVLGDDGQPVMTSGNFAVVFKTEDMVTGKFYALKCFTKEQEGREKAYHQIAEELKKVNSPYLISIQYLDTELFVDTDQTTETEFPVLLMDWVEGKTLDKYLRENLDDKYALEMLAYRFSQLAQWLIPQSFAHGDLKPDNILVREDGTIVLVDYDGMYVPAMKGQKARELGSPDFRHPLRTENDFDEHIDNFSLISILLSLKAISCSPKLYEDFGAKERLLLSERDYYDLSQSNVLVQIGLLQDTCISKLLCVLFVAYGTKDINSQWLQVLQSAFANIEEVHISTIVTKDDLGSAYIDEYGVMYSHDKKRLLSCSTTATKKGNLIWKNRVIQGTYEVKEGTICICDHAFFNCRQMTSIKIPESVKCIGNYAFAECWDLSSVDLREGLKRIGVEAFRNCISLHSLIVPSGLETIGIKAFEGSKITSLLTAQGEKFRFESMFPEYKEITDELPF